MTILEIMNTTEEKKIKLLAYAKDGNSVVTKHIKAHPIVGNFYLYKTEPDKNDFYDYIFVALFSCGYGITFTTASKYYENRTDLFESLAVRFGYFASEQAYLDRMENIMAENRYMRNLDIRMAGEILRDTPMFEEKLKQYTKYKYDHDTRAEQERQLQRERWEKEQVEREKKALQEYEETLRKFCKQLLDGGKRIPIDVDLLFDLVARLDVSIPIRVKGWMRNSLRTITISNGKITECQYVGHPSKTFFQYANQILSALQENPSVV